MSWFMDPSPDGDTVHQIAAALRTAHDPYNTQIQRVQSAHDTTITAWSGPASTAHTGMTGGTQQVAQQHAGWLVVLSDTFMILGTLCKIIFTLQMAWLAIQAATVIWGIFTAGLDALVTEGPAAALAVAIQGLKDAAAALLQALARALANQLVRAGAVIGGASGVMVGIQTAQQNHLDGWQTALTIFGDGTFGAFAGGTIGANPFALIGTAIGVGQDVTGGATDAQSAFDNIVIDTFAVGGLTGSGDPAKPDPTPTDPQPLTVPQGLTDEQFAQFAQMTRDGAGNISSDIVVQGSRAAGTAGATSDIDIAVRVDQQQFDDLIQQRFGEPNPDSAKWRTMQHAIETGKIQAGEAGLRWLRKQLESTLGMDVDISVILKNGPFDQGPIIPLP
jgi:Nucleotidyltransferase domain